ncbi:MAG: cyclic nucleotide-binding domain-containing protein [Patescibacteria group bacterium]
MIVSNGEAERAGRKTADESEQEDEGQAGDGNDTLEVLFRERPKLSELLSSRAVVAKQPGDWLHQEGDEVTHFAYVVMGRVKIITAGEITGEVRSQELLGLDEFLLRDENPKYVRAAQAVEPTFLLWLDEGGLRRIADIDQGAIKAFMRLQARIQRGLEEAVRRLRHEKDAHRGRAARLSTALGQTQDELAKASARVSPPPPPRRKLPQDLLGKLQKARETNQNLVVLINERAKNLEGLLAKLREVIEKHPEWVKEPDFAVFLQEMIALVERDAKREIVLPP